MEVQTIQRPARRPKRKKKNPFFAFFSKIGGLFFRHPKKRTEKERESEIPRKAKKHLVLLSTESRKLWQKIFFFLSLFLLVQIVFEILLLPFLNIRFIEIKGTQHIAQEEVLTVAGIQGKEYYFSLDEKALVKRIEELAWIKKAEVTKVFPNRLKIFVEEREPVFLHLVSVEERKGSIPVLLDDEGIAFVMGEEALAFNLPILSGITVQGLDLKSQFPLFLRRLFQDAGKLKRQHKPLYDLISEVYVQSKWGGENFDLSLHLTNTPIVFQLASHLDEEKMTQILLLLDVTEKNKTASAITEVDLRSNEAVYRYGRE